MCAIRIAFQFQVPELPVSDTCAELLVPNTVALHGDAGLRKLSLLAVDMRTVLST
jgi:hypothetical protein